MKTLPLLAALVASFPLSAQMPDLNGVWEFTLSRFGDPDVRRLTFKSEAGLYTTNFRGVTLTATVQGSSVEIVCSNPKGDTEKEKNCGKLSGRAAGASFRGEGTLFETPATWEAHRPKSRPPDAPRLHVFEPKEFHRQFSGKIPPALTLYPGDTVRTWSVDAGGVDSNGKRLSLGGNPLTGPFYIEGALPGDTLVIRLNRVRLNRDTAESGDTIVGSLLGPYYFKDQKEVKGFDSEWKLDRAAGTGALAKPTDRLKNFKVPLRPMVGCIGVAPPAGQAFRSGFPGSFGGNMDYNEVREGVTVYLPVYQPGAILFIGDGHAAQGDGELTGDALETSLDLEFTVDVMQDKSLGSPAFENDEFYMVSGIANSLPEAVQQANTGLSRYLEREYKLNPAEIGIVLGSTIRYDIAELVDPLVHVVAKIRKDVLAQLK
jgi:amidase